jgi:hypothetical protein
LGSVNVKLRKKKDHFIKYIHQLTNFTLIVLFFADMDLSQLPLEVVDLIKGFYWERPERIRMNKVIKHINKLGEYTIPRAIKTQQRMRQAHPHVAQFMLVFISFIIIE